MRVSGLSQVLKHAEAVAAGDPGTQRLSEVASAVESVVSEVPDAGDDVSRQLHKLAWIICQRSGGCLCDDHEALKPDCRKANSCMLDRP